MKSCLLLTLCGFLAVIAAPARAQAPDAGPNDGMLHILRPILNAEQEKAELCLEFDRALDPGDFAKIAGAVKISSVGKAIPLTPQNLSLTPTSLCVSSLEHRTSYHLVVSNLVAAAGEKLHEPYHFSFTVPDRTPSLAFLSDLYGGGLLRWQDNDPTVRAINVRRVKLELYRVAEPGLMTEGWRQRLQTTLAPSESAYFARQKGKLLWQGEIILDDAPNQAVEQKTPLRTLVNDPPPGFYLITASAVLPKSTVDKDKLAPLAATWLLRSGLRLHAETIGRDIHVFAEQANAVAPAADVRLILEDGGQQPLAEGKTDADGIASISLPGDKKADGATLIGMTNDGDVAFADPAQAQAAPDLLDGLTASIAAAKNFYAPGEQVDLALSATGIHGQPVALDNSHVQILHPDRAFYTSLPVPKSQKNPVRISFAAPAADGGWILQWQGADGRILGEAALRVTSNPDAPRLEATAGRVAIGDDGALDLALKSINASGKPAPLITGRVGVDWVATDMVDPWRGYHFGQGGGDPAPAASAFFTTDAQGAADIHMHLAPPADAADRLFKAVVTVQADPTAGAADPDPLRIPLKPHDFMLGVKALTPGGRFSENGIARFDVIAIDGDGKRIGGGDLRYRVYEEGRSFDWYQDDGTWNYNPQQQRRRIGGGAITVRADSANTIDWPVTAGNYLLEITDAKNAVLARIGFSAGWDNGKNRTAPAALNVTAPSALHAGEMAKIHFRLDRPAMVAAIVADDRVRQIVHEARPAGDNDIAVTPSSDWGDRVRISVAVQESDADTGREKGQLTLPVLHSAAKIAAPESKPEIARSRPVPAAAATAAPQLASAVNAIVAPQQSWTQAAENAKPKARGKTESSYIFVGPRPLYDLPRILAAFLQDSAIATQDMATSLNALRLWRGTAAQAELLPASVLLARQHDLALRLMARQKPDGSFPSLPGGDGDGKSTDAALAALAALDDPLARIASDHAADWLKQKLDNNWFAETDRPERAASYAALASAGRLDPAHLQYFADTSADKSLPPLAAAQLAFAFAKINDADKSGLWLKAVGDTAAAAQDDPELLPYLAENNFFDERALLPALEKLSASNAQRALFLRTLWHVEERAGNWRLSIDRSDQSLTNVFAFRATKTASIRNPGAQPLYLALAHTAAPAIDANLVRGIYRVNGDKIDMNGGKLQSGEFYLVMLEGPAPGGKNAALLLHDDPTPGLLPLSCAAEDALKGSDLFAWLRPLSFSAVAACEKDGNGVDILVTPRGDGKTVRAAYFAKAGATGSYTLAPFTARAQPAGAQHQGAAERITVQ